ncbi:hypothetical protein ACAX43_12380 [Paraburkholderia sp. IW21]|uniref:hypothetical protein n=1 Tax=Paraburkholderia sp. IW21 TaxID=3242488 RepID=UPI003522C192
MTVATSISQLNVTPSLNTPVGSEPIGNNLAGYLQSHAAFIAQVANGTGINMSKALSMNSYQINNLANGTANTDAVTYQQLKNIEPIGTIKMWNGTATQAAVVAAWGSNWALCDGTSGTPDLRNRFVIGAGSGYATGATGGTTTYTLSVANMPSHNHGVNDPGHAHGVSDPGHAHGVYDPGHAHNYAYRSGTAPQSGSSTWCWVGDSTATTSASGTGIGIYGAGTGIGIYGSGTGVSIQYNGSGAAFTVIPPYYALVFVCKIANT